MATAPHFQLRRLWALARGVVLTPARGRVLALAVLYGLVCHVLFAAAVAAMIAGMFVGMSAGLGTVPAPWHLPVNALLILQFPLAHSFLLGDRGRRVLGRLSPPPHGRTLATTTYAIIASAQLLLLFTCWTPSGIVWWQADGAAFAITCTLYALSWLMLVKASLDAGAEVQSGALGWMSLAQGIRPVFPDMPTTGLFRVIRQPVYVAFALTLWTVPVWTPDQLALALAFTAYCLTAPRLKERRLHRIHGERFAAYRARVPYVFPRLRRRPADG
ncbi:methyltransferase family protein [Roseovarius salis]|uniref:methyltransferase family protein n=1 Tax=Roseovarius salis TaxID=3376063 RepID=UPI0037C9E6EB